jgi:hypothetical protein
MLLNRIPVVPRIIVPRIIVSRIIVLLIVTLLCACGRPSADNSSNADSQKLPFDREPRSSGISPSRSLIPSTTKLPDGTPIPIQLQTTLSSAWSHAGDTFSAVINEALVIDGQTLLTRGTSATGRVLEAKPAASSLEPGYLRIVLVSLKVGDRQVMIETSSIFAKGGSRDERNPASAAPSAGNQRDKDVVFGLDRRLSFRLAQAVDLQ